LTSNPAQAGGVRRGESSRFLSDILVNAWTVKKQIVLIFQYYQGTTQSGSKSVIPLLVLVV
jgi:hypothetical protein